MAILFVIPIVVVFYNPKPLHFLDIGALFIWLLSIGGESVAENNYQVLRQINPTQEKFAVMVYGDIPAILIIFLNGYTGGAMFC
ncbi:MAG: hypothetical protein Ct9H300mP5_3930 [Candidatus Pelagibacterales bacterium]|nr:MAG: hypothetical protein Ct9H300mP5_3930 [Pelagibacterales bacterium]